MIAGFRLSRDSFGLLLLGQFDGGKFRFARKVRHGFEAVGRAQIFKALKPLRTRWGPFSDLPTCKADPFDEGVTAEEMDSFAWIRPEVEVDVAFPHKTLAG